MEFTHGYLAVAAKDLVCAIIPFGTLGCEGRDLNPLITFIIVT